jgi:REP element-mobilizing transposase RayT
VYGDEGVAAPECGMPFKRLPHVHAPGMMQHVVFCTTGAWDGALDDHALGQSASGRLLVGQTADVVAAVLTRKHGEDYVVDAWCVMPNHVHALVTPYKNISLSRVVAAWKSVSAREAGLPELWQKNYFDRYMREEEQPGRVVEYIENNPVAAGLVEHAWQWRWSSAYKE